MLQDAVLITGTSRRVGLHLAKRLHHDGYTVLAQFRTLTDGVKELQQLGVETIQADFVSTEQTLMFVEVLKMRCVSLRAIIHNASSYSPTSDDLTVAAAQFEQFFQVHMMAPFLISQGLHEKLIGQEGNPADIIHITDINAENPTPKFDIYGTTKAGLHNMMLVLAKKFAPEVKVNAIAPGPILFNDSHTDEIREQVLSETPLACEGGPEPIYLAVKSLMNNPFMTGAAIPVDGGRRLSKR